MLTGINLYFAQWHRTPRVPRRKPLLRELRAAKGPAPHRHIPVPPDPGSGDGRPRGQKGPAAAATARMMMGDVAEERERREGTGVYTTLDLAVIERALYDIMYFVYESVEHA